MNGVNNMEWTIRMHWPEREEYDGYVTPERNKEYKIPFTCWQTVYYVHKKKWQKKKSPWVITKTKVLSMWASNTYGVQLGSGECIGESEFKYLFTDRDEAIDFCLKMNKRNKVKVYGE
jgi:hypothetical protein